MQRVPQVGVGAVADQGEPPVGLQVDPRDRHDAGVDGPRRRVDPVELPAQARPQAARGGHRRPAPRPRPTRKVGALRALPPLQAVVVAEQPQRPVAGVLGEVAQAVGLRAAGLARPERLEALAIEAHEPVVGREPHPPLGINDHVVDVVERQSVGLGPLVAHPARVEGPRLGPVGGAGQQPEQRSGGAPRHV